MRMQCWKNLGLWALLGMLLTACGNKGPLALPDTDTTTENVEQTQRE